MAIITLDKVSTRCRHGVDTVSRVMGRAIVREPSIFLTDEPLSNLDPTLRVLPIGGQPVELPDPVRLAQPDLANHPNSAVVVGEGVARVDPRVAATVGQRVQCRPDPRRVNVLDRGGARAISWSMRSTRPHAGTRRCAP